MKVYQRILFFVVTELIILVHGFQSFNRCDTTGTSRRSQIREYNIKKKNCFNNFSQEAKVMNSLSGKGDSIDQRDNIIWNVKPILPFRIINILMLSVFLQSSSPVLADVNVDTMGRNDLNYYFDISNNNPIQLGLISVKQRDVVVDEYGGIDIIKSFSNTVANDNNDPKSATEIAQEGGKWFFVIYVVFSIVAGIVEMTKRFQKLV